MIDPFKVNFILEKIERIYNVSIDFVNIDEKYFHYILYLYQTGEYKQLENHIVEIEFSKDKYICKRTFDMNQLFYYKFEGFECIMLETVRKMYDHIYKDESNNFILID